MKMENLYIPCRFDLLIGFFIYIYILSFFLSFYDFPAIDQFLPVSLL